jgi:hypothetical protein
MQVLCKPTDSTADIYCPVCEKGYNLFWERTSRSRRAELMPAVLQALREQHDGPVGSTHSELAFNVPTWAGQPEFSAAALLGGAY